jgi:hypothetical protein
MSIKTVRRLRHQAFVKQACLCFYCELPMWETNQEQFLLSHRLPARLAKHLQCTAEHLLAQQDNGCDTSENIVAACLWCNRSRHQGRSLKAPDPHTYKSQVAEFIAKGHWHPVIASKRLHQRRPFYLSGLSISSN